MFQSILVPNTIKHDEDNGHTEWDFEFGAYPPVNEDQIKWVVTDKRTNERTKLSLGDSSPNNIFSANPQIEITSSPGQPSKHKVTLKIQPQNEDGTNSNFDVKFIIKVIVQFHNSVSFKCLLSLFRLHRLIGNIMIFT